MDAAKEESRMRGNRPKGYRDNLARLGQVPQMTMEIQGPGIWPSSITPGATRTQYTTEMSWCKLRRERGESCSY